MPSVAHVVSYVLRMFMTTHAIIYSYFCNRTSFPPQVPSFFAGCDNGLLYILHPRTFLSLCKRWNGPVYKVSLGSRQFVVVSSGDAISSVLSVSPQLLSSDTLHEKMYHAIAGTKTNFPHLYGITVHELYPLFDRSLSPHSLDKTMQTFGLVLLSRIEDFVRNNSRTVSLEQLTNEPLFTATNHILFGRAFGTDAYGDFKTLNKSIPDRYCGTLLWHWPSYAARMRLLTSLRGYLQREEYDTEFSRGFVKVFKDNDIRSVEGAQMLLTFLWTLHSNMSNNAFFLLSFLLNDPGAFARVRGEIDAAVETFGSLETLLCAGPGALDDSGFELLTSALMETMRFTSLHAGVCRASCDVELRLNDPDGTTIPIGKGEYVFGDVHAVHMDAKAFPDPEVFVVDRFARQRYRRKHLQTEGYPYYAFGGGKHLCKGRWLALYEMKVLVIILLRLFDFSPAVDDARWCLPRVHPRSIGVVHTEDNVFVRLSLRQALHTLNKE